MAKLTAVSLFSGCGGSDMGLARAGIEVIFANDVSRDAVATYKGYQDRFAPAAEVVCGDIRDIEAFPTADVLVGCYPCQSFSMGGPRSPDNDPRSTLFREFYRALKAIGPRFFVVENVSGLAWLSDGRYLRQQINLFKSAGPGYRVASKLLNARDYGVPADRRRIFLVGVRKDHGASYQFPDPTHGEGRPSAYVSHGDAIDDLPLDGRGEHYDSRTDPWSWWYMSRNRKRRWEEPAFTIQANWRHVALHPASPRMTLIKSDLANRSRQEWAFAEDWDHLGVPGRPKLESPRRLTWRECSRLQTLPHDFEPAGTTQSKFEQVGNAVPPTLMHAIASSIANESALKER